MLTIEEVRKIAVLAKIKLTAQEEERHAETISAVLEYMKILNEVNTEGVEPTFEVNDLKNIWREDKIKKCDYGVDLVEQFPQKYAGMLVVPGVFDNE
ncbi:MAG: Asp-tRNA(Asn)/Glu-tRNA(Gln) amidotransferase subunit GatC [Candidatus Moranbacteria bacterium]|jgi:aspartyl-tRNA(Asn)/glutamyl-tRNA(Gln) amidotransferase subunit C|nr:Asp-tRNA(Asn)/Glu-tRNA(Gln) amidotransferase subunit GatC [Candidatus Moranbacteria bacterium]